MKYKVTGFEAVLAGGRGQEVETLYLRSIVLDFVPHLVAICCK
ncbi:MAG: hypothetical protein PUP90_08245 [Nostoc sp. S4]|nr:hypothetical protein [Nostoc sp. S4]